MTTAIKSGVIRCHKCRQVLVNTTNAYKSTCNKNCESYNPKCFIYLLEDQLPPWIQKKVDDEQWTRGKLHCENCGSKIGSFDFVSGRKCDCGSSIVPPVHFITSQIDIPIELPNLNAR